MTRTAFTPRKRNGFVLVAVLWMMVILTVIVLGFSGRVVMERRIAWYAMDKAQAQQMARGAVNRAILELQRKSIVDALNNQGGYTGMDQHWAQPQELLDSPGLYTAASSEDFALDSCSYIIEDCESRINLNKAPSEFLRKLKGLRRAHVETILGRREYEDSMQPYMFVDIDDVLDLSGLSESAWYGDQRSAGIRDLVTVWGNEEGRININTASEEVLALIPGLSADTHSALIGYLSGGDDVLGTPDDKTFKNFRNLSVKLGVSAEKLTPIEKYCTVNSSFYTIKARATRRGGKIKAYCQVTVRIVHDYPRIVDWREDAIPS